MEGEQAIPLSEPVGGLKSMVLEEARGPFEVSAELRTVDKVIQVIHRRFEEGNRSEIGPDGGTATGLFGNVQVYFPPEALEGVTLDNPLIVRIRPPISKNHAPYYLSDMPFEIVAEQQPDGPDSPPIPVREFKVPVEIRIDIQMNKWKEWMSQHYSYIITMKWKEFGLPFSRRWTPREIF